MHLTPSKWRQAQVAKRRLEVLKRVHEDIVTERDRLRDARATFTSRLGPLPASAAIAIGLVGSTARDVAWCWILAAGVFFVALVMISGLYSGLTPYRVLRARKLLPEENESETTPISFRAEADDLAPWLNEKVELEERICGDLRRDQRLSLRRRNIENLQVALDAERTASYIVQTLFVLIIGVLIAGIVDTRRPSGFDVLFSWLTV
jgi:hypothetical protein